MSVLRVKPSEELASLIDRAINAPGDVVYIVLDNAAHITQNVLNLRLLKREGDSVGKEFIMVSKDARVRRVAQQAALKTQAALHEDKDADTVPTPEHHVMDIVPDSEPEPPVRRPPPQPRAIQKPASEEGMVARRRPTPPSQQGESYEFTRPSEPREPLRARYAERGPSAFARVGARVGSVVGGMVRIVFGNAKRAVLTVAVIGGGVALFYVLSVVLPTMTITVTPQHTQEALSIAIVADANISSANVSRGTVPAQILEERQERTFTFRATGEEEVQERATGTITVFNAYSSDPQLLVASTRFLSADGKLFRTTENVTIPGATIGGGQIINSSTSVHIEADEAGESFNIGPSTFSIPGFKGTDKYLAFFGKSESAMSGGFTGVRTVVTEDDLTAARETIEAELLPRVEEQLRSKIPDSLFLIENSLGEDLEVLEFDAEAGNPHNDYVARVVARARAFLVAPQDIEDIISNAFRNSTEFNQDFELSDERTVDYVIDSANFESGSASITLNVQQTFVRIIDTQALAEEVRGKDEVGVRAVLSSKEELERAQVRFWPLWVKKAPNDVQKITVETAPL
jgi:hypothetical protein